MADNIKLVKKEYVDTELSTKANKVISNMSYESFIDTYHLREPEWVDLSFVGGEYYYTDLTTAVTDVNNGNTASASSDKTGAVCQIFTDGNITVLRLLSDITITTNVVFTKSVIFDINGFTVTVRDSGRIGSQTVAYDISVIFYGAKTDSNILSTNMLVMFANTSNFFLIGGKYSINSSLAGAYVIYVPPYNIPINVEICNAELQVIYNNPQSTNNISCVIITNKTSITNLLINNTKCVTNGTNRYTYAYITTAAANPETKVTILNSDIEAYGADQSDNSPCGVLISAGYANIISSNIKGITSGIQVGRQGNVYIKDSKCYAPYHGGIYNAHILYAENTEFHRSATPEGYTPSGAGCAYFGYGSTAYINNCKFIRDVESDTSPGIAVKAGTAGAVTRVFVSNSEMPGIRCDADQEIYLGNGISDTIKNATVQGIKYLTDNNYVYIEESNSAYSLLNPNFNAVNKKYVDDTYATKTDLSGKLDKVTSTSTLRRAYSILPNGTGYIQEIDYNATASTLALRDSNGALRATTPTASSGGDIVATKKYVDDSIATQVSSVYKAKGSIADISALPTPDKAHEGFVYNIENEFTTTDQFVEGAGKTYPAGTNVVCINTTGTTYKWDVLAGMVDLSNYATKTELSGKLDKVISTSKYNRLYGIETTGNQALFNVASYVLAGSIAQRKADGTLNATTPTADSSDDTVTTKKYVDDAIGNITALFASLVDMTKTTQTDEPTDDTEIVNEPTADEGGLD